MQIKSIVCSAAFVIAAEWFLLLSGCNSPSGSGGGTEAGDPQDEAVEDDPVADPPNELVDQPTVVSGRIQQNQLTYLGAFRLPDEYNWGARGATYNPAGNGGDGSLLVTGFEATTNNTGEMCWEPGPECQARFGEVAIPTPQIETDWESLPVAEVIRALTGFDGGLMINLAVNAEVSDIELVPQRGSQSSDKLYGVVSYWYAEGDFGTDSFPTVWFSELDGSNPRGLFHVGPTGESPFHGRKMGAYLFTVPLWYANQYLGGRTLVTGRARGTPLDNGDGSIDGGSQGPTLFAFSPWDNENPSGHLDALPMLYYRVFFPGCAGPNVGAPDSCDFPAYTMCDEWMGATFIERGEDSAIVLAGRVGMSSNCYDEPPVVCDDVCDQSHGYHCYPYERRVIFYDVDELGRSALGELEPWTIQPYITWEPEELMLGVESCWRLGGMTFDTLNHRLFLIERGLGTGEMNANVVHVWSVGE